MKVFVSYTRSKNIDGVVDDFTEHFRNELSLSVPEFDVFQDKNINPGDDFKELIKRELEDADVLLVLVSPAWLKSSWCRWEFEQFSSKKTTQGQPRRVLPVLWVPTAALQYPGEDPIAQALKAIQYDDWHDLRHELWSNPEVRKRIAHLAETTVAGIDLQRRIKWDSHAI